MVTPKHVLLPHGVTHAAAKAASSAAATHALHHQHPHLPQPHQDPWHQFEGLVFVLIGIHVVALLFWSYLLYASRSAARSKELKDGGAQKAAAAAGRRSPKDILKAYKRVQLGKA